MMDKEPYEPLAECHCPICGKIFFPTPVHVYRANHKDYCSWTCFNRRNKPIPGKKGKKNKEVEQLTLNGEHLRYFKSGVEAANYIDGDMSSMYNACGSGKAHKGYLWRYVT